MVILIYIVVKRGKSDTVSTYTTLYYVSNTTVYHARQFWISHNISNAPRTGVKVLEKSQLNYYLMSGCSLSCNLECTQHGQG